MVVVVVVVLVVVVVVAAQLENTLQVPKVNCVAIVYDVTPGVPEFMHCDGRTLCEHPELYSVPSEK